MKIIFCILLTTLLTGLWSCDCESANTYRPAYKAGDWPNIDGGYPRFNELGIPPVKQPATSRPKFTVVLQAPNYTIKQIFVNNGASIESNGHTVWTVGAWTNINDLKNLSNGYKIKFYYLYNDIIKVQGYGNRCPGSCIIMRMDPGQVRLNFDSDQCRVHVDIKFFHIQDGWQWKCGNCN